MAWRPDQISSQRGRTFVVTGANGGLGEVTTRVLADKGAAVVMACRNVAKAQRIAEGIDGDVRVAPLDLGDLSSVREFAAGQDAFDVLINNAGVMYPPFRRTVDGFETQFGINHLGHFALTGLLLGKIGDRIVTLSSIAHKQMWKFPIDDLNYEHRRYQRVSAYAQSKLANLMFARELQRRLTAAGSEMRSYAVHPGVSGTDLFANTETVLDLVNKPIMALMGHPPEQAAQSTLFAATTPGADPMTYWGPTGLGQMRGPVQASPSRRQSWDRTLWRRLWEESERMTEVRYDI